MVTRLTTDYLIVGAGAMGMSFLEELISCTKNIQAIIIDSRSNPGGHWNDAYPFVHLHQPAITYGVNSRTLGTGGADMASKTAVLQHYELAMKDLLATGRVQFFPQCRYMGSGKFVSMLDDNLEYEVEVNNKIVDATCTTTDVPSTHAANFKVSNDVTFIPINGLAKVLSPWPHYLIIGAGKTGIDAILFLITNGVDVNKISWVMPRDSWFWNRKTTDSNRAAETFKDIMDAILDARVKNYEDAFRRLEDKCILMRLDGSVWPQKSRGASVTTEEFVKLRLVKNVIRKGRIYQIEQGKVVFLSGEEILVDPNTLYVDCSANGCLSKCPAPTHIWEGKTITIHGVIPRSPCISACIIAAMEVLFPNDEMLKNQICIPVVPPQMPLDFFTTLYMRNINDKAIQEALGFKWFRNRRTAPIAQIGILQLVKMIYNKYWTGECFMEKLKGLIDEGSKSGAVYQCYIKQN